MTRKTRIILTLAIGVLVGSLVFAASLRGTGAWSQACWHLLVKLGIEVDGRCNTPEEACSANLKQIDGAKATWALENKKTITDVPTPTDLYGTNAYIREEPACPLGGKYVIGSMAQKPRCSIPG